jgi:hypothetical protein
MHFHFQYFIISVRKMYEEFCFTFSNFTYSFCIHFYDKIIIYNIIFMKYLYVILISNKYSVLLKILIQKLGFFFFVGAIRDWGVIFIDYTYTVL